MIQQHQLGKRRNSAESSVGKDPALKKWAQVAAPTQFQLPEKLLGAFCPKINIFVSSAAKPDCVDEVISRSKENLPGGPGVFSKCTDAK